MARVTPPPGSTGLFQLRAPFSINPNIVYHVSALRGFDELIARGTDPMALVYTPAGAGDTLYQSDVAAGAMIVALSSDTQPTYYVPDTYIDSYPNMAVVPHSWLVATCSLGMLPDTMDTTGIAQAIKQAISDFTGVESTVTITAAPTTDAVTQTQYVQLVAARQAAIKYRSTAYAEKLQLQSDNENLRQQNAAFVLIIEAQKARIDELEGGSSGTPQPGG